jgi:hypothetical protein
MRQANGHLITSRTASLSSVSHDLQTVVSPPGHLFVGGARTENRGFIERPTGDLH